MLLPVRVDVDVFDHHCPWVSNCVGKRNYRYFFTFVWMTIFLALFASGTSIGHLVMLTHDLQHQSTPVAPAPPTAPAPVSPPGVKSQYGFLDALARAPASLAVAIISVVIIMGVVSLGSYHISLLSSGLTTSEDIKGKYDAYKKTNAWFQGSFSRQLLFMLCSPHYPSALDKHHRYDFFEDYINEPQLSAEVLRNDYPGIDDHRRILFPNTYVDPFTPGSFNVKKPQNQNPAEQVMSDSDDSDGDESRHSRDAEDTALLGDPDRV